MRIFTLSLLLLSLFASRTSAAREHRVEIDGTFGYRFGGAHAIERELDDQVVGEGRLRLEGAPAFGGLVAYRLAPGKTVFVSYSRQVTDFVARLRSFDEASGIERNDVLTGRGSIEYFQFGGNLEGQLGSVVVPYLGASVGLTRLAALEGGDGARGRFNITLDGGLRFDLVDFLDLRILGRIPFTFPGSKLYCYSGVGCAVTSNGSPFVQGEVHAGIGVRF